MKTLNYQIAGILFLFILLVSLLPFNGVSQINLNYYSLIHSWDSLYDANPDLKQEEDGGYTQYLRWKEYWKNRVYCEDTSKSGSFQIAFNAKKRYSTNKNSKSNSLIAPNWRSIGPRNLATQNLGLVSAVYVDTLIDKSMNTIYIGTNSSGVWKTVNGGLSWNNITDASGFILNGVTDITGDLNQPNVLYFTSGGNIMGRDYSYGTGVFKTTDGGLSWTNIFPVLPDECISSYRVLVDPANSQRIYALIGTSLYRTDDAGSGGLASWKKIFTVPRDATYAKDEYRYLRDIEMKPDNPSVLYLASDYFHWEKRNNAGV